MHTFEFVLCVGGLLCSSEVKWLLFPQGVATCKTHKQRQREATVFKHFHARAGKQGEHDAQQKRKRCSVDERCHAGIRATINSTHTSQSHHKAQASKKEHLS
jgi:hypothetical protein